MTGSGKTGLGIGLIEEAALDGVPVLAIDPKGDLANLLLTFPDLAPGDFAPWVDAVRRGAPQPHARGLRRAAGRAVDERPGRVGRRRRPHRAAARRGGLPPLHARQPRRRAAGAARLAAARRPTRTPTTRARGSPPRPRACWRWPARATLAPHSREQALVAAILAAAHRGPSDRPQTADLPWLVGAIQKPPFDRIGVLDLETFYPAKDRQDLALRFNSVLATPGFDVWLDGDPLDVGSMLLHARGQAARGDRVDCPPRRHRADARGVAAPQRRCSSGRAGRAAPARCGPCSTWTKCSATCRRWPTRRRKRRCSRC